MQGGGGSRLTAFTMAEILLSLTIIGVVAAITLPSLTGNINERTWNTQRKALYARISQAIALMPALNGYGTLDDTTDTAAETFVTAGLSKVLKINNICDNEHFKDCGLVSSYINITGSKNSWPYTLKELNSQFTSARGFSLDIKAAAFETANGESIAVYYNPKCISYIVESGWHVPYKKMCANFIYDLNGSKGPNTVGKDIGFITALYNTDPQVVAPIPLAKDLGAAPFNETGKVCTKFDSNTRMPSLNELYSMHYNEFLIFNNFNNSSAWWSSTVVENQPKYGWLVMLHRGEVRNYSFTSRQNIRCVKR